MANIFKLTKDYYEKPKRNAYDLSFTNNLTAKFGYLYPVFIKEVNPGDSMSIHTTLGLRAEPMVFPVQSRIRADIHYFYVRNRTLWEKWMDWYGKTETVTSQHPFILQNRSFFKSKTLADYLGVPTSYVGGKNMAVYYPSNPWSYTGSYIKPSSSNIVSTATATPSSGFTGSITNALNDSTYRLISSLESPDYLGNYVPYIPLKSTFGPDGGVSTTGNKWNFYFAIGSQEYTRKGFMTPVLPIDNYLNSLPETNTAYFSYQNPIGLPSNISSNGLIARLFFSKTRDLYSHTEAVTYSAFVFTRTLDSGVFLYSSSTTVYDNIRTYLNEAILRGYKYMYILLGSSDYNPSSLDVYDPSFWSHGNVFSFLSEKGEFSYDASDDPSFILPWSQSGCRLSALPFRAYESIYNSYYRNYMNDPFMLDGEPQYNRYVTNLTSGADTTPYKLYRRNWELDFLTSATQSPQQGEAPLIGVTVSPSDSTATLEFFSQELQDLGVSDGIVKARVSIDDTDGTMVGINYVDKQLPQSSLQRLMEAVNYGISINDLRNVNSLQRWLEKNIRRGYRYIDQIKSHFGVSVSYKDLLMPEFIGGFSQLLDTNVISQTTPTSDAPLGAFGGQAVLNGSSNNNVTKYCDEAGFIIGIMSIVPTPVYSQVPHQFFFKENVLDYYFPEFGKIPMQPIYNRDITPLQTDTADLFNVFGYQRPWWHLISSVDEVHGEFRTDRQGYLVQRLFKDTPVLNGDFLKIDNSSINNVFYVDDEASDQFLGQIHFKVTKKTAIPLYGIPSIE